MTAPADLPLWPDTVDAFYAQRACSIRSAATRRSWGYTYRWCNASTRRPRSVGSAPTTSFAFVTQWGLGRPPLGLRDHRSGRHQRPRLERPARPEHAGS
jgi:hypothetical protein